MALWLTADRPDLDRIVTTTAASNEHMIRVNGQIGYVPSRTMLVMNTGVSALLARLIARS
jgi:mycothiol synthase